MSDSQLDAAANAIDDVGPGCCGWAAFSCWACLSGRSAYSSSAPLWFAVPRIGVPLLVAIVRVVVASTTRGASPIKEESTKMEPEV